MRELISRCYFTLVKTESLLFRPNSGTKLVFQPSQQNTQKCYTWSCYFGLKYAPNHLPQTLLGELTAPYRPLSCM